MIALTLFAKAPSYQARVIRAERAAFDTTICDDSAHVALAGTDVVLPPKSGELVLIRRYSVGGGAVMTWIGLYRRLERPHYPQRGGLFYGAGIWTVPAIGQGPAILRLLRKIADGLDELIPSYCDVPWSIASVDLSPLRLTMGELDQPFARIGTGGAMGDHGGIYGTSILLDLSTVAGGDIGAVLDDLFAGKAWSTHSNIYLTDDPAIVAACRIARAPEIMPKQSFPPRRDDTAAALPQQADHAQMDKELKRRSSEVIAETEAQMRRMMDSLYGEFHDRIRSSREPAEVRQATVSFALQKTRMGNIAAKLATVASVFGVIYSVYFVGLEDLLWSRPKITPEAALKSQASVPPPPAVTAPTAAQATVAAAETKIEDPHPAAATTKSRQERQAELLTKLNIAKSRLTTLASPARAANWADTPANLDAVEKTIGDVRNALSDSETILRSLRADAP